MRVLIQRLDNGTGLPLPRPATAGSAGFDLPAAIDGEWVIAPGQRRLVPTGFAVAIPEGFEGQVRPRSGLALRFGIVLPNSPGTVDSDYRGELRVILLNTGSEPFTLQRGDRIAQIVIAPVVRAEWQEAEILEQTDRGAGGFGHSGTGSQPEGRPNRA